MLSERLGTRLPVWLLYEAGYSVRCLAERAAALSFGAEPRAPGTLEGSNTPPGAEEARSRVTAEGAMQKVALRWRDETPHDWKDAKEVTARRTQLGDEQGDEKGEWRVIRE